MKNKLITFFGGSLSNFLLNFCCIYNGIKSTFGDKVVITGSAAVLLHAINILGLDELNNLDKLKELVSIVKLEDSGKFRITSDFDFLIVQKEPYINLKKIEINRFKYEREQDEPGSSLTFKSDNETCPDIDISVRPQINYNEINYNGKIYNVHSLKSLLDTYNQHKEDYRNSNKINRNGNKIKLLQKLKSNEHSNLLETKKFEEVRTARSRIGNLRRRGSLFSNNSQPRDPLSFDNNSNNNNSNNNSLPRGLLFGNNSENTNSLPRDPLSFGNNSNNNPENTNSSPSKRGKKNNKNNNPSPSKRGKKNNTNNTRN